MAGRREELQRDLARLQAQLRGERGPQPVYAFLDGLVGGLVLGAALALFAARRSATVETEPLQEASIELKARAAQLAQEARAGAEAFAERAGVLTEQAKAALDRVVPGDQASES